MVLKAKKKKQQQHKKKKNKNNNNDNTTKTTTRRIHQMLNRWNQRRQKFFFMIKSFGRSERQEGQKKGIMHNFGGRRIKEVAAVSLCSLLTPAIVDWRWSGCNCGGSIRTLLAGLLAQFSLVGTFWTRLTGLKICRKIKSAVGKLPSKTLSYV